MKTERGFKETVRVISRDPPIKERNVQFTKILLQPLCESYGNCS